MHEIPNFPYPSLHEPEQTTTAQQERGQQAELKASTSKPEDSRSGKSQD